MTLRIVKNTVSGADMVVPTTDLVQKIHEVVCCVTQITDFENHCDAFSFQQEILELLETKGANVTIAYIYKNMTEIDEVFFYGKSEEILKILTV